jgi:tyrosine-protein kinase Etk/Wzc
MLDARNNVLLVTGPTPGVGKSFVSANLAAVLGSNGKRVLLIDADMRKGHLNRYFGVGRNKGLSELLSGSVQLADAVLRQAASNVDLITTGAIPENPAELLARFSSRVLVEELVGQYDLIVVDTPPVLAVSDTAIIAPLAGAVLLVSRAGKTTLGELRETNKRLRHQCNVQAAGVVFNGMNVEKRRYGHGYGSYRYTNYEY